MDDDGFSWSERLKSDKYIKRRYDSEMMDNWLLISLSRNRIFKPIAQGDLDKVKYYVESGNSVNTIHEDRGDTLLHFAVMSKKLDIVDYLLSRDDILVNVTNNRRETPLMKAIRCCQLNTVKKLVHAGADVNLADHKDKTPLHRAIFDLEISHFLIQNGAEIDAVDRNGATPLFISVRLEMGRDIDTMHMLLYYNADANRPKHDGCTPFMQAISFGRTGVASNVLLDYIDDVDADVDYEGIILNRSLELSNVEIFKAVWERLRYNPQESTVDLKALFKPVANDILKRYIQVIIDSDNMDMAVQILTKNKNYYIVIDEFANRHLPFEQLEALTCRLLMYGYRPTTYDIYAVFLRYGYNELFKLLRYMDIDYSCGWRHHMGAVRLMFDLDYKLLEYLYMPFSQAKWILERFAWASFIDRTMIRGNDNLTRILVGLTKVPSLKELARDAARQHIRERYQVTSICQFYTIIDHLNILAPVYKKILTLESKVYTIHV